VEGGGLRREMNRTAKYEEWDFLADKIHHRIEQERIRRRRGRKISLHFLRKIAMRMGLEQLQGMSYDDLVAWVRRQGL